VSRRPLRPDGVLLDMDGTLVDTEPLWFAATRTALRALGADLPDDAAPVILGLEADAVIELLRKRYAIEVVRPDFDRELRGALGPSLAGARARPGAEGLVARILASGVPRAIVSNSSHEVIAATLAPHPWAPELVLRYSVDDVARGKPSPDVYHYACGRMDLAPRTCVAVEDSVTGATAAVAAGIACIAVAFHPSERSALAGVTPYVVGSLAEALDLLDLPGGPP
jgi:beta-phosphoglucomutase-like phosphatase (HAD superfamily)